MDLLEIRITLVTNFLLETIGFSAVVFDTNLRLRPLVAIGLSSACVGTTAFVTSMSNINFHTSA